MQGFFATAHCPSSFTPHINQYCHVDYHAAESDFFIGDLDKFTSADFMFHMAIVESGHSKLLSKIYQGCRSEIYFALREMNSVPESHTFAIASHTKIYEALIKRNYDETAKIYKDTFEFNRARYKKLFRD